MQSEFRNQDKSAERRLEAVAADVGLDLQPWVYIYIYISFSPPSEKKEDTAPVKG